MISFFVLLWATVVAGRPNVIPLNVVTVPPNCPVGQQWINGQCRDIWNVNVEPQSDLDNSNVITVPPNCPAGQEWINEACRDVWKSLYEKVKSLPTGNAQTLPINNEDNHFRPQSDPDNTNVITVPPNCPAGQEWINGACRDVWKSLYEKVKSLPTGNAQTLPIKNEDNHFRPQSYPDNSNVITVPPNCPAGQEWINEACRDVWRYENVESLPTGNEETLPTKNEESTPTRNVITVPTNCPPGQQLVNGVCRDIWNFNELDVVSLPLPTEIEGSTPTKNVITVPTNCPSGQQLVNGVCRDIWNFNELDVVSLPLPTDNEGSVPTENEEYLPVKNVITVPTNCPSGQEWINGACRDVWRSLLRDNLVKVQVADIQNPKNIITVPNQCPVGYRPDAHGICREIFP